MPTPDLEVGGAVGEVRLSAGVPGVLRQDPYSSLIVNDNGYGRYFESTRVSRVYTHWVQGFTVVAANATALAAATQLIVGIVNPLNSGKAGVILRVDAQSRSGTPGGPLYLTAGVSSATITTASAGTATNAASFAGAASIKPYHNVALTGFVSVGNVINIPLGGQFAAALAAGAGPLTQSYEVAGAIIIPPGGVCGITATAAGTTHIVDASLTYAEIEWPL